jgi:hypothetical protein
MLANEDEIFNINIGPIINANRIRNYEELRNRENKRIKFETLKKNSERYRIEGSGEDDDDSGGEWDERCSSEDEEQSTRKIYE